MREFCGDAVLLLRGRALEYGTEEEETEHGEHDEEFHGDDDPERSAPGHLPESVDVESQCLAEGLGYVHVRSQKMKSQFGRKGKSVGETIVFSGCSSFSRHFGRRFRSLVVASCAAMTANCGICSALLLCGDYKSKGLATNEQGFGRDICHSR